MMLMSTACSGGPTTLVSLHHVQTTESSSCGQLISSPSEVDICSWFERSTRCQMIGQNVSRCKRAVDGCQLS